ncbi:hypothetical protein BgiMline_004067, partial [Biomphalaria glabrata]
MAVSAPGSSILLNNGAEIVSRRVGMRLAHFRDNSIRATEEGEKILPRRPEIFKGDNRRSVCKLTMMIGSIIA